MKITLFEPPSSMKLDDFADRHELVMEVHRRPKGLDLPLYYAHFADADVKDGHCLIGEFGDGATIEESIANYALQISGKLLVVDAMSSSRREIQCPDELI